MSGVELTYNAQLPLVTIRSLVDISLSELADEEVDKALLLTNMVVVALRKELGIDAEAPVLRSVPDHRKVDAKRVFRRYLRHEMFKADLFVLICYGSFRKTARYAMRLSREYAVPTIILRHRAVKLSGAGLRDRPSLVAIRDFSSPVEAIAILRKCLGTSVTRQQLLEITQVRQMARQIMEEDDTLETMRQLLERDVGLTYTRLERRTGIHEDYWRDLLQSGESIEARSATQIIWALLCAALGLSGFPRSSAAPVQETQKAKELICRVAFREDWSLKETVEFALAQHPDWTKALSNLPPEVAKQNISLVAREWRQRRRSSEQAVRGDELLKNEFHYLWREGG
ncbi:hypothetical protein ACFLXE_02920 [Chloroflexota bacterium]